MDARDRRARQIQRQIAAILHEDWDPIGIRDEPACRDEYDGYVGGVYRLLASGASADELERHLERIAREEIGLGGAPAPSVIEKLLALDVRLDRPPSN